MRNGGELLGTLLLRDGRVSTLLPRPAPQQVEKGPQGLSS